MRDPILAPPQVHQYFPPLFPVLRGKIEEELTRPDSRLRFALSGALRTIGSAIAEDTGGQARTGGRIDEAGMNSIVPWRQDIGQFVGDVVRSWETSTIVDRVELAVGRDLQYIRVNGTLVGAAVGCAIFALSSVLR